MKKAENLYLNSNPSKHFIQTFRLLPTNWVCLTIFWGWCLKGSVTSYDNLSKIVKTNKKYCRLSLYDCFRKKILKPCLVSRVWYNWCDYCNWFFSLLKELSYICIKTAEKIRSLSKVLTTKKQKKTNSNEWSVDVTSFALLNIVKSNNG